jgi:predicted glycogen debranching enzyme
VLSGVEQAGGKTNFLESVHFTEFRLESGLPVWTYQINGTILEKRVFMPYKQNTVHVKHRVVSGDETLRWNIRLAIPFRAHSAAVGGPPKVLYDLVTSRNCYEIHPPSPLPVVRLSFYGDHQDFTDDNRLVNDIVYRIEEERGYESREDLFTPGFFQMDLNRRADVTLIASTEDWETISAFEPDAAHTAELKRRHALLSSADPHAQRDRVGQQLVFAADQFIISPPRMTGNVSAGSCGPDNLRTIIAGYHWFTDWGRDTMISLEGLTLITGRQREAREILCSFSNYVRDGLIPNLFPEGQDEGRYDTADATLWFFHAIDRYLAYTQDWWILKTLLPKLVDIVEHHLRGTRYGIRVDPEDGLLSQGDRHYALTWMDAKYGQWIVTPRRGKAVEINALWYNALCLLANWVKVQWADDKQARQLELCADRARTSFNRRFWNPKQGYLYDVIDGEVADDTACRPNQIFAIALPHPVLNEAYWKPVFDTVRQVLLTPVGLRTLEPKHGDYKLKYHGNLMARDSSYHQGTVWPWLLGPFIDAWLKVIPGDKVEPRRLLKNLLDAHLTDACVGSIGEIFDAEEPFAPRGCVAQAWSVAEVLRSWVLLLKSDPTTLYAESKKRHGEGL